MNFLLGKNKGNFETSLYDLIVSLPPEIKLYHLEHGLRPPLGIYNVSMGRVWKAFELFLDLYKVKSVNEELNESHNDVLDSLMAFIDDCFLIMKCFYSKDAVNKDITYADRWLEKVNKEVVNNFRNNIEPYRNRVYLIVNKVKHNHARYCNIEMKTTLGKIHGYYIEGVDEKGVIVPNKEIHKQWNGMYTAISYNIDLRRLVHSLFAIASFAEKAINQIIKSLYGNFINPTPSPSPEDGKIKNILMRINKIQELYFHDEYNGDVPEIIIKTDEIELRQQAYSKKLKQLPRYTSGQVNSRMSGDGVTNSWALPYFKR